MPLRFTTHQDRCLSKERVVPLVERRHPILQLIPAAKTEWCVINHLLGSNRRNSKKLPNRQHSIHRRRTPFPAIVLIQIALKRAWIHRLFEAKSNQSFLLAWRHLTSLPPSHAIVERFAHRRAAARMLHRLLESLVTTCCNEKQTSSTNTGTK